MARRGAAVEASPVFGVPVSSMTRRYVSSSARGQVLDASGNNEQLSRTQRDIAAAQLNDASALENEQEIIRLRV
jgi:hypothetical protein